MITQEQRNKYDLGFKLNLQWARLDVDYYVAKLDTTLPIGTIVQVVIYRTILADLYINGGYVDGDFPYDAATLLEDE